MKKQRFRLIGKKALVLVTCGYLGMVATEAQFTFSSGSTGVNGALSVTTNMVISLPPDGILNYTTVTVASNAILNFVPNAANTPVYLLAQGDIVVDGTIDVSGQPGTPASAGTGGPGGFAGGMPGLGDMLPGDGCGPGAGRGGTDGNPYSTNTPGLGSYGTPAVFDVGRGNGSVYGSKLLVPLVGGSGGGGGGGFGGGGGGGAVLLASSSSIRIVGSILANGSPASGDGVNPTGGIGSGGAIRLLAPVVSGTGSLNVGGNRYFPGYYGWRIAGSGRVRIDCMDRRSIHALQYDPAVVSIGANMVVFPTNAPRLDIVQVGTNSIPEGTGGSVFFLQPQGSPQNQNVRVQARNFGGPVNLRVVLTPDNGEGTTYATNLDNTVSPASVTVPVVLPVNVKVQVSAWTW